MQHLSEKVGNKKGNNKRFEELPCKSSDKIHFYLDFIHAMPTSGSTILDFTLKNVFHLLETLLKCKVLQMTD